MVFPEFPFVFPTCSLLFPCCPLPLFVISYFLGLFLKKASLFLPSGLFSGGPFSCGYGSKLSHQELDRRLNRPRVHLPGQAIWGTTAMCFFCSLFVKSEACPFFCGEFGAQQRSSGPFGSAHVLCSKRTAHLVPKRQNITNVQSIQQPPPHLTKGSKESK